VQTRGVTFVSQNGGTLLLASVIIVIALLVLNRLGLLGVEEKNTEREKVHPSNRFLIGYDIKAARVGGIALFLAGLLGYLLFD
jgi:hypothetical protein